MLEFESDKSSLYLLADKTDHCWGALVVAAIISLVTGVILWITVAVVVSNPPTGSKLNSCLVTVHASTSFSLHHVSH